MRCAATVAAWRSVAASTEKLPGGDPPPPGDAGGRVELGEVLLGEAGGADHHVQARGQRRIDVLTHDGRARVIDEHVARGGGERLVNRAERGTAAARDPAGELEIVGGDDRLDERSAGPTRGSGDQN